MSYTVTQKEWSKLDKSIQKHFAKKLIKCQENLHIMGNRLRGIDNNCYKIKLRASGFRLLYQVKDDVLIIIVVAVGKRDRSEVYNLASERLK